MLGSAERQSNILPELQLTKVYDHMASLSISELIEA